MSDFAVLIEQHTRKMSKRIAALCDAIDTFDSSQPEWAWLQDMLARAEHDLNGTNPRPIVLCNGDHAWPDVLTADAVCANCGLLYGDWEQEGDL